MMGLCKVMCKLDGRNNMEDDSLSPVKADKPKCRVLLVEDDRLIRFIHTNFLEKLDCIVQSAENGQKALEMLKNQYDIVFMDMGLPDMTGMEVVKSYRNNESQKRLPIIALTAYGGKDDRRDFIEAGVNDVIVKPVTVQQLDQILQKFCNRTSHAD